MVSSEAGDLGGTVQLQRPVRRIYQRCVDRERANESTKRNIQDSTIEGSARIQVEGRSEAESSTPPVDVIAAFGNSGYATGSFSLQ
jgi:hypothetical protein